jgi:hypothetical protein
MTLNELRKAIEDHINAQWGDEGYDESTKEFTYYDHKCSDYCAEDILKRVEANRG